MGGIRLNVDVAGHAKAHETIDHHTPHTYAGTMRPRKRVKGVDAT
jgi:hypothetical protein